MTRFLFRQAAQLPRFGSLWLLALGQSGCFEGVNEAPEPDIGVTDAAIVFKPDADGTVTRRLGKDTGGDAEEKPIDVAGNDLTDAVTPTGQDAVADTPSDGSSSDAAVEIGADVSTTCGNGSCSEGENCQTCTLDCGNCPAFCGNGVCDSNETCVICAKDCGVCPPPVCNVLISQGCAAGQQCFPDGKANLCYAAGVGKPGETCSGFNTCVPGALCVAGQCRQLCDWTGKDANQLCKAGVPCEKLVFDGAGEVGQSLGACKPGDNCNPLTDEGCKQSFTCVPYGWLKTCTATGTGPLGSACSDSVFCGPGLFCINGGKGGKCVARCHTNGETPKCATGTCTPVLGPDSKAVPGFVGSCTP